jgi:hypothetical protein
MAKLVWVDPEKPEESRKRPTPLVAYFKDLFKKSLYLHAVELVLIAVLYWLVLRG